MDSGRWRSEFLVRRLRRGVMTIKIRLPGGTLKIKKRAELRRREQKRDVPVWQIGSYFIVWWPNAIADRPTKRPDNGQQNPDQQKLN
jgi:hypothetical protein